MSAYLCNHAVCKPEGCRFVCGHEGCTRDPHSAGEITTRQDKIPLCYQHRCGFRTCFNPRQKGSMYCAEHVCSRDGCANGVVAGEYTSGKQSGDLRSTYCIDHWHINNYLYASYNNISTKIFSPSLFSEKSFPAPIFPSIIPLKYPSLCEAYCLMRGSEGRRQPARSGHVICYRILK